MYDDEFGSKGNDQLEQLIRQYEEDKATNGHCYLNSTSFEQIIAYYDTHNEQDKASEALDLALDQYPYSALFLLRKAQMMMDNQQFERALELLDKAEILDATELEIYLVRSEIYSWQGKHKEAIACLKGCLGRIDNIEKEQVYLEMADVYEDWDKLDMMFDCLKRAVYQNPRNEEAMHRMWFCVEVTERFEDSVKLQTAIINKDPYAYLAWYNLGQAYYRLNDLEQAVNAYEYCQVINEDYDPAYKDCGDAYFELAKYDKAIEQYQIALRKDNRNEDFMFDLAETYEEKGELPKAKYYYEMACRTNPVFHKPYYRLGLILLQEMKYMNALNLFRKALNLSEANIQYRKAYAGACLLTGMEEEAEQQFETLVSKAPQDQEVWLAYISMLFEFERFDDALGLIDDFNEHAEHPATVSCMQAVMAFGQGKRAHALMLLEEALEENPHSYQLLFEFLPDLCEDNEVTALLAQYEY